MSDKPKSFYQHPIGAAISWAVHEQNSGAGNIRWQVKKIREYLVINKVEDSVPWVALEYIESALKQQQKGMDSAYEKTKKELGY
jgi:hypothetical protein